MTNPLQEARNYLEQYQFRINQDSFRGDLESRTRYENAAYQEGMLSAAIAQAEHLKRIADALELEAAPVDPRIAALEAESARLKAWQRDAIAACQMARGEAACDG